MEDLSQYSLIGNCRSAALVSRHGSIDWCCLPGFDSPAIFSALLDQEKGGHFSIRPAGAYTSRQAYVDDTNVVETFFETADGSATLTDAFAAAEEEDKKRVLFPDHEMLRVITCSEGAVQFQLEFAPKIYYGKSAPVIQHNRKLGIQFHWKENTFILQSNAGLENEMIRQNKLTFSFHINKGERMIFSFSCSSQSPAILPEIRETAITRMNQTIAFWKTWTGRCTYSGAYKKEVKRSILALKLLAHAPSGAIIAAPTTSLPEQTGGERNWDYRYCWLRDASFTVRVLSKLGFRDEVHAYMNWMVHATQLTRPKLQVVYSVFGNARLREKLLPWLSGYKNSKPVRIGNGAYNQHQLDVYGEVLDAFFSYSTQVSGFDKANRKFITGLGDMICRLWNQPDNGIWEMRTAPAHYTHSKVMAWVGLDRLIKISKKFDWKINIEKYEHTRSQIQLAIESSGYDPVAETYVSYFDSGAVDASALVFSLVGYCDAAAPRMTSTISSICSRLSRNKLIYRYQHIDDGLKGSEGSFGICNFWLVENLARSGRLKDAVELFEHLLTLSGETGLMPEQADPVTHELLGNYPQGFTHIGLINAALSINDAKERGGINI